MDAYLEEGKIRIRNKQGIKIVLLEKDRATNLWEALLEDGTPLPFNHRDVNQLERRIKDYYFGKVKFRYPGGK